MASAAEAGAAMSVEQPVLASCYQAAAAGFSLLGSRAGQPTLRLLRSPTAQPSAASELCAEVRGVNVHAMLAIDGRDRPRLLRLCRFIARPPLAQERLTELPHGRLRRGSLALVDRPTRPDFVTSSRCRICSLPSASVTKRSPAPSAASIARMRVHLQPWGRGDRSVRLVADSSACGQLSRSLF